MDPVVGRSTLTDRPLRSGCADELRKIRAKRTRVEAFVSGQVLVAPIDCSAISTHQQVSLHVYRSRPAQISGEVGSKTTDHIADA